jgi:hypothetical protein
VGVNKRLPAKTIQLAAVVSRAPEVGQDAQPSGQEGRSADDDAGERVWWRRPWVVVCFSAALAFVFTVTVASYWGR